MSTKEMGGYDVNHQLSAINNSTPLHSTPRFWSCMEAAASAVAENRSVVVVVGGGAFHCLYCPLQSHRAGDWWSPSSRWNMSGRNIPRWLLGLLQSEWSQCTKKNKQKNEQTNRVTISSRKETCYWVVFIIVVLCIGRSRKLSLSEDLPAAATAASEASR